MFAAGRCVRGTLVKCIPFVIIIIITTTFLSLSPGLSLAAPTGFRISVPLYFGGRAAAQPERVATPAQIRAEKRLRLARYAFQLADAIVSAIGYQAYARCLSCLAYPGGGPLGSAPVSVATFNGDRPAESNPLVAPFSRGGILSLAAGALAYDFIDARVEKHWSVQRRTTADLVEIGAHAWGISTWLPELKAIRRDTMIATACGVQWHAKSFGEAFSNGCVNQYYRAGAPQTSPAGNPSVVICAPAQFKAGTYLFATADGYFVASGVPCANLRSPFP